MADMSKAGAPKQAPITPGFTPKQHVGVGGEILSADPITYNEGRYTAKLVVHNTGDRPIQVGSHFHFFEVNRYLEFDRWKAFGCHLNIPATTAVRFEPGEEKEVEVVAYSGKQYVMGFNGLVQGFTGDEDAPTYFPKRILAIENAKNLGFKIIDEAAAEADLQKKNQKIIMATISRQQYNDLYGPTVGDKIRLGDTDLYVEITKDLCVYGDEIVYGGGKTLRDGMGLANTTTAEGGTLDLVITNVTIIDPILGVIKADVGI